MSLGLFRWFPIILFLSSTTFAQSSLGNWENLGPLNFTDRLNDVAYKPGDPDILIAASQGIWRSTDGGAHWSVPPTAPTDAISTPVRFDPANPNNVYVGVPNFVYKSTDSGATWTNLMSPPYFFIQYFKSIFDIAISKANPQHIYITNYQGLIESFDGGLTWSQITPTEGPTTCSSVVLRDDAVTDIVFVVCEVNNGHAIFRNTDAAGSGTWELVLQENGMGPTKLALAPSDQSVIYALSSEGDHNSPYYGVLHALFRSTAGGAPNSWTAMARATSPNKLSANILSDVSSAYAVECGTGATNVIKGSGLRTLAVDPNDPDRVWVGSTNLFRSDDGGVNFGLAGFATFNGTGPKFLPAFSTAIAFHPGFNGGGNTTMVVSTDQGIYRTFDARQTPATGATAPCDPANSSITWSESDNGLVNGFLTNGALLPDGTSYRASSNHGFIGASDASSGVWEVINPNIYPLSLATTDADPNLLYAFGFVGQALALVKSTDGGIHFQDITGPITGIDTYSAIAIDPSNQQIVYVGAQALWRTIDGGITWTKASADTQSNITAIGISSIDPNHLYIGSHSGVASLTTGQTSNSSTTLNFIGTIGSVTSIVLDPRNDNVAYASLDLFSSGSNGAVKTTNRGLTWATIGGFFLPSQVFSLVLDPTNPDWIYAGTQYGLYFSPNAGAFWIAETGIPYVPVSTVTIRNVGGISSLMAFTQGRGVYRIKNPSVPQVATMNRPPRTSRPLPSSADVKPQLESRAVRIAPSPSLVSQEVVPYQSPLAIEPAPASPLFQFGHLDSNSLEDPNCDSTPSPATESKAHTHPDPEHTAASCRTERPSAR